ncbi:MAG: discoidin domain-containing protein [Planctomycetota bacterium]|jgi:hypothetical protein
MCRRLIFLTSFVLVMAVVGTNVAFSGIVVESRVSQDTDDNEETDPGGAPEGGSSDLEIPYEGTGQGTKQLVAIRWQKITVPNGARILDAYIEFQCDELKGGTQHVSVIIEGELNPNPPTFTTSTPSEIADRQPRTVAQAIWEPEHWTTVGTKYRTSNIAAVIEEIVGQSGWYSGNALILIIRDNPANPSLGVRCAESYGGDSANAALLHIEYVTAIPEASKPSPADGAIDVPRDVVLGWTPGDFAAPVNGHKVYFSENFNDVSNGIGSITQDTNSYDPGRLDFSKTYYWRIDEVNGAPDYTVYPGDVWSFTTELIAYPIENVTATASSQSPNRGVENTVNGSGLDESGLLHDKEGDDTMWLSDIAGPQPTWIEFEFDKVYKLHELLVWNSNDSLEPMIGFGFKDVTIEYSANGTDYTTLGTTHQFTRAPGMPDYGHNTTIDFGGVPGKYVRLTANSNWGGILPQFGLSEIRFSQIPVHAKNPYPDSGAAGVPPDVVLGWAAGREAVTHDVYVSTDEQAVIDDTAPVATVAEARYGPLSLDLGVTHYWKVNEVNEAKTPSTWESAIWNFTTTDHLVVDDFESYNDLDPGDADSKRIFNVWIDGYGVATNGSLVGYENPPFCEQTIVHGGKQSMPLAYSNTGGAAYSEAELTLTPAQDWTASGVVTLVVYFHGTEGNTGQLYAKINGSKVVYGGDAADITRLFWQPWSIDLASLGLNLQSITKLAIGIDGNGAAGTLYVDDIGLYVSAPERPLWFEAEAADSITPPMKIYDDPAASGGKYIGTDDGIGDRNDNPPPDGVATYSFTAEGGTYKILLRVIITGGSNSFWVRIPGATNHDPGTHPANPGWIRFNDISDGAEWHWDEVHSNDHNNEVVKITLPAGAHTLEIAQREDGALLDAIVISKID